MLETLSTKHSFTSAQRPWKALWRMHYSNIFVNCPDLLALVCDVKLRVCYFPNWYPGSGVVLDCIDS